MLNGQRAAEKFLLLLHLLSSVALVWPHLARVGEDTTLTCRFAQRWDGELSVEWTLWRAAGPVVAYFYHRGSALDEHQDAHFRGRATVNESRLGQGDASLRLRGVTAHDEGSYRCIVYTPRWKNQQEQQLNVTAPYSQPQVSCLPLGGGRAQLTCLSSGGFPQSALGWCWGNGSAYTGPAQATEVSQAADGTFGLQRGLEVDTSWVPDLRCVVTHPRLNQTRSGHPSCPDQTTRGTDGLHHPEHCPQVNDSQSPCCPQWRIGLFLSAAVLLALLTLVSLRMRCCGSPFSSGGREEGGLAGSRGTRLDEGRGEDLLTPASRGVGQSRGCPRRETTLSAQTAGQV
ncbi:butyrophilin subfamily 1 member A1-like [Pristis pectinata]|uniref:butyrophilin subfamily 1 member A1-like n=1 Tax=Pristis pectinata TaxID=685728 RepID=UPI00223E3A82|nr:butyrophilin subfamily 1 member A1-like [Pristis pectinata]